MKYKVLVIALSLRIYQQRQVHTLNSLPAKALKPFGRYITDDQQNLELISSAVNFGFSFEGSECLIYTSLPGNTEHKRKNKCYL